MNVAKVQHSDPDMAKEIDYGKWIADAIDSNPRLSRSGLSRHLGHGNDRGRVIRMIAGDRKIKASEVAEIAAYLGVPPPGQPGLIARLDVAGILLGHAGDAFDVLRQLRTGARLLAQGDIDLPDRVGDMAWMQIAIKPAKPFAFGTIDTGGRSVPVFGLPGNPLSALVTTRRIARPVLAACGGSDSDTDSAAAPATTVLAACGVGRRPVGHVLIPPHGCRGLRHIEHCSILSNVVR